MLRSSEHRRMPKMMHAEPASVWMAIAECIAALAAIALVAVIGYSEYADRTVARSSVAAATSEMQNTRAQEHRKQLFDQPRERFQGSDKQRKVTRRSPMFNGLPRRGKPRLYVVISAQPAA